MGSSGYHLLIVAFLVTDCRILVTGSWLLFATFSTR